MCSKLFEVYAFKFWKSRESLGTVSLYTYITPWDVIKLCICINWNKGQDDTA